MSERRCSQCRNLGWVLEGVPNREPAIVSFRPCSADGCPHSGRTIAQMEVGDLMMGNVDIDPETGYVRSINRWLEPLRFRPDVREPPA